MTQYLPAESSKILLINQTDKDCLNSSYFDDIKGAYIYCKGDYFKINQHTLWVLQQGKHNLISSLSDIFNDALSKEKLELKIYFDK